MFSIQLAKHRITTIEWIMVAIFGRMNWKYWGKLYLIFCEWELFEYDSLNGESFANGSYMVKKRTYLRMSKTILGSIGLSNDKRSFHSSIDPREQMHKYLFIYTIQKPFFASRVWIAGYFGFIVLSFIVNALVVDFVCGPSKKNRNSKVHNVKYAQQYEPFATRTEIYSTRT